MNVDIAAADVVKQTRRVITLQLGIATVLAGVFFAQSGTWAGIAAAFGGLVSVCTALQLAWGVVRAAKQAQTGQRPSMGMLYLGALQRFLVVLALFALGLGWFKLPPLPAIIGFGVAQLAYAFSAGRRRG